MKTDLCMYNAILKVYVYVEKGQSLTKEQKKRMKNLAFALIKP